ncbi:cysteine--tRNA ligase [Buchnera aphidicola]|uniref:cysteine--tRNA ligase n=1 Tax=Buchnera aphidicola TaxID=9 RepID=UPI0020930B82|nr:cysteine--tRNA ligase [Buchnera aphidicola]USS94054.1 cysteine--tRNA ligase [Buchnera aphidicola (Sipha maydis)]WII23599.1 cysteine--tRNA ligase [Buchnera aphidicola (Sipha maydis)]
MLKIFNTLTRKKEIFKPIEKKKISLYVCGVTVYDYCHIGHARTFIFFDVVNRYFKKLGYKVKYVRNITDIDDKIILKSKLKKIDYKILTKKMINSMTIDFDHLNILKPDFEPLVTNHISEIISFISILLKKKYAYINFNGDVVFPINKFKNYGELSRKKYIKKDYNNTIYSEKNDFILWKKSKNTEFFWDSPWGNGRPGWHIECSTICYKYFGSSLDIHGGGSDLIFPHHENENAQSICFNQKKYVNYWMHTGMIILNNRKMSKSYGNIFLIKDLKNKFLSDAIRHYFLSTNYRHPIYYNIENLRNSEKVIKKFYFCINLIHINKNKINFKNNSCKYINLFKQYMDNNFNTREALFILLRLSKKIIYLYKSENFQKAQFFSEKLFYLGKILGFFLFKDFRQDENNLNKENSKLKKIKKLVKLREQARKLNLWEKSDFLREKLIKLGVYVEDQKDKTFWKIVE